ncbi:hypothetical protein QBC32DRAFT_271522 [Pseudoneurospora amorphoporcata]|uniref:Nephrocystin 3-like N-terminal domain-containing protein n=1 Tax=Pseudoneurospora amorphoporcata TaxID=241081 RepID=A0AAN6NLI7_9PEZI|nr:hypothetical protein QBC32DRAFT_271522 [Pseudoneurospora amorphoporcata]
MEWFWSFYNFGSGFSNANTGPGAQYNNNAGGPQYNYNYYGCGASPSKLTRTECLRSLSFSNIDARRQDIAAVHPNTGDWIFQTTEFRRWRDRTHLSDHNGVLWIKGHPGTGKSTLMKHIWGYCQQEFRDRTIAAYFFHARGDSLEKTPLGMLRSLVSQLVDNEEPTYERFLPLFRQKNPLHQNWEWRDSELMDFLVSEMQVQQRKPIVLLIDALDECSDSQARDVVKFLERLSITCLRHEVNVCICLSSRHYPHISMAKCQERVVENRNGHDMDIDIYLYDNLTKSNPYIEKLIFNKASGIFLWVVLVVAMLNKAYDEGKIEAMEQKCHTDICPQF